ncbi:hypothetical protein CYMTET_39410, partial [Cymbomonas tetramitiformis]
MSTTSGQVRAARRAAARQCRPAVLQVQPECGGLTVTDETSSEVLQLSGESAGVLRRFVILCHNPLPPCACEFRLMALDVFRLDLVCRCISSAFMVSSAVRDDTELVFVFPPSSQPEGGRLVLRVVGSEVGSLRPNERALASALRYAIYPLHCKTTVDNTHVPPTVSLEHEAFESRHPAPEGPVVNPKGSGRRRRRGDSEGRPWRRSAESKQCARGIHVERVELLEEVLGRLAGPLFVLGENAQQEAGQRVDTLLEEARSAQQQWRQQQQQGPSREGSSAAPGDTWTFVLGDAQ